MPLTSHLQLCFDIKELLLEVEDFQFHDFKNSKYATPKVELYKKLIKLANNVKSGEYDDEQ